MCALEASGLRSMSTPQQTPLSVRRHPPERGRTGVPQILAGARDPGDLGWGLFVALMVLPGLQLGASVLTVILVALFYPERSASLRHAGQITLWSFGGALLGTLLMGTCLGAIYFWPGR